jgi:hypothetical protein
METVTSSDLLSEAVETAASFLRQGDDAPTLLITDRSGDLRVEEFDGISPGRTRMVEFLRGAAGDASCALVFIGRVKLDESAIVIECGVEGSSEVEVFVQRFRPRKGRFRGFKLLGEIESIGAASPMPSG